MLALALRGLRYHARIYALVLAGITFATAILVGALMVGDSVRFSLKRMANQRLGGTRIILPGNDRFFRSALADETDAVPLVVLRGNAAFADSATRANKVQVIGCDQRFWALGNAPAIALEKREIAVNSHLARRLQAKVGDSIVLRVENPSSVSRDAPMSNDHDSTLSKRFKIGAIVGDDAFGRFSLQAQQFAPFNAFLPIEVLQEMTELGPRANLLLFDDQRDVPAVTEAINAQWQLDDAELELRELGEQVELRSSRIFLDPPVEASAIAIPGAQPILTYFTTELRKGDKATPYSMVAAVPANFAVPVSEGIVVNDWLAEDLGLAVGDSLEMRYYALGRQRQLETKTTSLPVTKIIPLEGAAEDPELMPEFPGIATADNCIDWDTSMPVSYDRIRDKDEEYWDAYGGTPKAFITLAEGQTLWANRFGQLTAVRFPAAEAESVADTLRKDLSPAALGLVPRDIRNAALTASSGGIDFGGLFIGFSFFLIGAAVMLTGLLFVFGIERRSREVGTLLALGLRSSQIRTVFFLETLPLAVLGGLLGTALSFFYTKAILNGLTGAWVDAVGTSSISFHVYPQTLIGGSMAATLLALGVAWWLLSRLARKQAIVLLKGQTADSASEAGASNKARWSTILTLGLGVLAAASGLAMPASQQPAVFFIGGGLLLIGSLLGSRLVLIGAGQDIATTLGALARRNMNRRRTRSLTVIALLACGSFMVVAVSANKQNALRNSHLRSAGTGGFTFVAELTHPLYRDLNDAEVRADLGLEALANFHVVPLRMREGDDASCLNLNRPQVPPVFGVEPQRLADLGAFSFTKKHDSPWLALADSADDVAAIADQNTLMWALKVGVGDVATEQNGRSLRIVNALRRSILQGAVIIDEKQFEALFPDSGYRLLLIDAKLEDRKAISRALRDHGAEIVPASERLARFNAVENTYLSVFQVLGGLGLLLGSVGLALVVLRNVLDRQRELALMRALGYSAGRLRQLIRREHIVLLAVGLICGVVTALIAVWPALWSPGAEVPWSGLSWTILAVAINGLFWVWAATTLALRGNLLTALRRE
ncbi:MAG: putative ABC transport system permease protein [Rhodothermales bacterium]|jgi:putative ABC transport system permease protein